MNHRGYTLLEMIIVVAIITILAGVSIPYYQNYITDTRTAALKTNLGNMRKVINDFRGDNGRGPFRVEVRDGATVLQAAPQANGASGSELVGGAIQYVGNKWVRRTNIKYFPNLPALEDPTTGQSIRWTFGTASAFFEDTNDNQIYDLAVEFAFKSASGSYDPVNDQILSITTSPAGGATRPLDFIDIICSDTAGVFY